MKFYSHTVTYNTNRVFMLGLWFYRDTPGFEIEVAFWRWAIVLGLGAKPKEIEL